jgi:Icc-related predicted phosphoesterase
MVIKDRHQHKMSNAAFGQPKMACKTPKMAYEIRRKIRGRIKRLLVTVFALLPIDGKEMKAWIFSDLHLEMDGAGWNFKVPDADVCICAGDVLDRGLVASVTWLGEEISHHMPVIMVPGNREYFRASIAEGFDAGLKAASRYPNLYVMDCGTLVLGGVRFIGATLWTDFGLFGDYRLPMLIAGEQLEDYREIKLSKRPQKRFTPRHALRLHLQSRYMLEQLLEDPSTQNTVVITHHAPSLLSLLPAQVGDPLSPTYASRLEPIILKYQPHLWVHGHVHSSCDYKIRETRIICNPRGFPGESETSNFDPTLVVNLN